jgi:hypothetical protein
LSSPLSGIVASLRITKIHEGIYIMFSMYDN